MRISRISAITLTVLFLMTGICFSQITGEYHREGVQHDSEAKFEDEYTEQIKQLVKGLEYSDKVAQDFVNMANGWKNERGQLVLVVWKKKLAQTKDEHKQGKISKDQLAEVEQSIAKELSQRIQKEINYNEKFFDLDDVIKNRQAQCLSYSQLFYVLGNSIGLSVKAIDVEESATGLPAELGHVACIVSLTNGKMIMVDLMPGYFISKPFIIKKEFAKVGNYWELKDSDNPLGIHRRIQIFDRNGLIAAIYDERACIYSKSGQHQKAISYFTKAIELNPEDAEAYNNRGYDYFTLHQYTQAISDYTKAIEFDPKYVKAYYNRGTAYLKSKQPNEAICDFTKVYEIYYDRGTTYLKSGQYQKAIADFTKAIELNPKRAEAYNNRGITYHESGQSEKAIPDFTKAIELNPKFAVVYMNRGGVYAFLGKFEEAKKDLLKAVELDPTLKADVKEISDHFKLNLKLE